MKTVFRVADGNKPEPVKEVKLKLVPDKAIEGGVTIRSEDDKFIYLTLSSKGITVYPHLSEEEFDAGALTEKKALKITNTNGFRV